MKKEDIASLAQLLNAMQDAVDTLEEAERAKDFVKVASIKREILAFQKKVGELL